LAGSQDTSGKVTNRVCFNQQIVTYLKSVKNQENRLVNKNIIIEGMVE